MRDAYIISKLYRGKIFNYNNPQKNSVLKNIKTTCKTQPLENTNGVEFQLLPSYYLKDMNQRQLLGNTSNTLSQDTTQSTRKQKITVVEDKNVNRKPWQALVDTKLNQDQEQKRTQDRNLEGMDTNTNQGVTHIGKMDQEPDEHSRKQEKLEECDMNTPVRKNMKKPRSNLFKRKKAINPIQLQKEKDMKIDKNTRIMNNIELKVDNIELKNQYIPELTDLEILLINSCKIDAIKVQTVVEEFIRGKEHISIFCFTETKVKGHDFQPQGIKMFSKHRNKKNEKRGGGLTLGYAEEKNVRLEEIETKSNDLLVLDGKINERKTRIILCYFDCTKKLKGADFKRNRGLEKEIGKFLEVEPGINLIVLGDMNGRLTRLEPNIKTDANGKMIERWIDKYNLVHLNNQITCIGKYTYESKNGKSAIDHILTNNSMFNKHLGMLIDEEKTMLNISDHNLIRAWFKLGNTKHNNQVDRKASKKLTWISREPDRIEKCVEDFKKKIGKKISFEGCMGKIKTAMECTMRRQKRIRRKDKKRITLTSAPWVDETLINNINLRSKLSKEWRYARNRDDTPEEIEKHKQRYLEQKRLTATMTGDKKSEWESKKIEETWKDSKTFWKMIKELLGKKKENKEEAYIYLEDGERKEISSCKEEFIEKWTSQVYQKLKKADFSFWSDEKVGMKNKMEKDLKENNSEIMENPIITEEEIVRTITNMKNGKASGIDNIPAEVMKAMIKDDEARNYIVKCFNKAMVEKVHTDWLTSVTTMIPKKQKPKILDHRPIAVTVNSNKIICTILRNKIEEFLERKGIKYNNQFGFTEGGRVEHCLFILDYITNMTYQRGGRGKKGKKLYFAFIDFKKAYDSIDREKLIEVMIDYKINPTIIDLIVQMYENDHTIINLGNMKEKVEVTGGIRQGCCISTLLFKMVTYKIIEELRKQEKFKIGKFEDNSIWLADDATLIAKDMKTMEKLLNCLNNIGERYGLKINEEKTKIMKIRGRDIQEGITGYENVKETTYLGIKIGGKNRNIFEKENDLSIEEAEKKVNTLMAEVRKSADKVQVGKAIWKLMSIPAILFGRAVVPTFANRIVEIQKLENRVWRFLLDIGGYSTVAALRGEMGASLVKSRVMETVLQYVRSTMEGKFENVKEMMKDTIRVEKGNWYKRANSYRQELGLEWEELYNMSKVELKEKIRKWDTEEWEKEINLRSTLKYYREGKSKIGYENCYRNSRDSIYYARARTNSLKLEEAMGRGNEHYDRTCKLCGQEEEDLLHFVLKCSTLENKRNYRLIDSKIEDLEQRLIDVLYRQENRRGVGWMIRAMWMKRKDILKIKEDMYRTSQNDKNKNIEKLNRSDPGWVPQGQTPRCNIRRRITHTRE